MSTISIIVATDKNNAIGYRQNLLCYLPADLKHFKNITTGHTIVMGRKTFESLPKGALPNRRNIVMTSNQSAVFEGAETACSFEQILDMTKNEEEIFIIGGATLYNEAVKFANKMYITLIDNNFDNADTYFPKWNTDRWKLEAEQNCFKDEKNPFDYSFRTYKKIQ
ncbi:MAG: dihydrofolate reductase [Bacteroidales bacterium]|nr:dihydrofolate reductase [Bacteroidales bacterium]